MFLLVILDGLSLDYNNYNTQNEIFCLFLAQPERMSAKMPTRVKDDLDIFQSHRFFAAVYENLWTEND